MKGFISNTFFGYFNYLLAVTMMASPWLFHFVDARGAALFFPFMFGLHQLIMAIFSRAKGGMVGVFPVQMHCFLDTFSGFVLMCTPWMYGFAPKVWLPHVAFGAIIFILGVWTKNSPLINQPHEMVPERGIQSTDAHEGRMMV
ncbi:SPW repeat domain-containing protein [Mucilaginibacter boryungensis]|uniref:SPW repeat-containing integral membrane domain-containing protein n=1 Tax=Mucilaginibacter boryungensis TaxID=768480 RepID=A0ABR9XNM4_9SPHI|nr:hypothetical protein [Mucilaginibacter boryungensis]MBE9668739.1 hypothetical protein [Mucilaginibacter boryungensis]